MRRSKLFLYFRNIGVSLSQLLNTLVGGDPDETLCSRIYKSKLKGGKWLAFLIPPIEKLDKDHFKESLENDEGKDQVW